MATLTSAGITFGDATVQTTAATTPTPVNVQSQLFTASGTWTCPTGVTQVKATVIGGGGGGGAGNVDGIPSNGGAGGCGGIALGYYTVVPGTGYTITVGAGGAGSNTSAGAAAGATSSFASFCSASGGGAGGAAPPNVNGTNGADGAGTNGTLGNYTIRDGASIFVGRITRPNATASTAALTFSATITYVPGAQGVGEISATGNNATGGVSGAVLLEYVS